MPKRSDFTTEQEWLEHLRIYFAAKAMQGMWPQSVRLLESLESEAAENGLNINQVIAMAAYEQADAMLAERERREG